MQVQFYNVRNTINAKKTILIVALMLVLVWYVVLTRNDFLKPSWYFQEQLTETRAVREQYKRVNNNNTSTVHPVTTNRTIINQSKISSFEETVELKNIKKSLNNIFFIESTCGFKNRSSDVGDFILNRRQYCALESSSRTNPDRRVYILHTCPLKPGFIQRAPLFARHVLNRPNVHVIRYDMKELFADTPVADLIRKGYIKNSNFPIEHAADVLRLALLWRYGGIYCDVDVITIRSVEELGTNFCGLETDTSIGNAILAFEPSGLGHTLLTTALKYINDHFDGSTYTTNGPGVITKTILEACHATIKTVTNCSVFTVYNHTVLYPVFWFHWQDLFNPDRGPSLVTSITKTSYFVHIWNKITYKTEVKVGSQEAYGLLADKFCPDVYRNCGDTF